MELEPKGWINYLLMFEEVLESTPRHTTDLNESVLTAEGYWGQQPSVFGYRA